MVISLKTLCIPGLAWAANTRTVYVPGAAGAVRVEEVVPLAAPEE
jgi:hypothetical protein